MENKQRLFILSLILISVSLIVLVGALSFLYFSQISTEKIRLMDIAKSQASLINSVAKFDAIYSQMDNPEGAEAATLEQIISAQDDFEGFGNTGEFVIGQIINDRVVILATSRQSSPPIQPIETNSETATPMRLALAGQEGVIQSFDYQDIEVLAAYIPLTKINAALVAKVNMSELREPFINAALWAFFLTFISVLIGIYYFNKIGNPIIYHLEKTIEGLLKAEKELLKKEKTLKRANLQIIAANTSKTEFVANVSHELRTPLNAIIGFSELIKSNVFGPLGNKKYQEYSEDINESGQHLLQIINNILDISKIEAGKLELFEEDFDIADVLKSSITMTSPLFKENEIEVISIIPKDLPTLHGDKNIIKQIILNLLSNAIKFTPNGEKVKISAEISKTKNLIIKVIDNGIGIAPKHIPLIMEPFQQTDNLHTRNHEGTGLGLPLSKSFMEIHDGSIKIESKIDFGTTIILTFPKSRLKYTK